MIRGRSTTCRSFMHRPTLAGRAGVAVLVLLSGCNGVFSGKEKRGKAGLGVDATEAAYANSAAFRDSIASRCYYEGLGPMRVRGYGLVVGLGRNGSRDCPKAVYDKLVQDLYKRHRFLSDELGVPSVKPEDLINDLDTAVVVVQAEIPPGAVVGTRFDVSVMALPGTQTKSLVGGRLFSTDLEVFRQSAAGGTVSGQVLARASGPLFFNPFSDDESSAKANPLQATILGGGRATQARRIRLVLTQPSHPWARRIQDRINARFPSAYRIADATSPSFVQLRIPEEYAEDAGHFLSLVRALYLTSDPSFEAARARALAEEIVSPSAPHALIASAWEGLGRSALPVVTELYAHAKNYVSFHAAVAGLRLDDHLACDVLSAQAGDAAGEYRFPAIRALGEASRMGSAAVALRKLLYDDDPRVQIAAYEALARRGDSSIDSRAVGGDNFTLEQVRGGVNPMVYARRTGVRKIALFGDDLKVQTPLFYRAPDGSVTITADEGARELTLIRTVVSSGSVSPPITASLELPPLIELLGRQADVDQDGVVVGLGLDYAAVVRALHHLCNVRGGNLRFVLEQPNLAELFGPLPTAGRPESEL